MLSFIRAFSAIAFTLAVLCPFATGTPQQDSNQETVNPPPPLSFGSGSAGTVQPSGSSSSFSFSDSAEDTSSPQEVPQSQRPTVIRQSIWGQKNNSQATQDPSAAQDKLPPVQPISEYDSPTAANLNQQYANPNEAREPLSAAQYISPIVPSLPNRDNEASNAIPNWNGDRADNSIRLTNGSSAYLNSAVQPAANFEPVQAPASQTAASQVIQAFSVDRSPAALPGQPVRLVEAMAMTPFESRPTMIRAYWQSFEKWALQVASQTEADQLAELQQPSSNIERDLLDGAISLARSRILETQVDLGTEQQTLRQFVATIGPDIMPLPSDLPLVDEYMTNYETLAAGAPFNSRVNQINEMLPKILQIIQTRAAAAAKCQTTARQAIQAYNQNQLPLSSALEAIRMCREVHQEFVRAVGRYNRDIAEYALTVAPFGQPAEQVVSMLIKPAGPQTTSAASLASASDFNGSQPTAPRFDAATKSADRNNALRSPIRDPSNNFSQSTGSAAAKNLNTQSDEGFRNVQPSKLTPLTSAAPKVSASNSSDFSRPLVPNQATTNSQTQSTLPSFGSAGGSFSFDKK